MKESTFFKDYQNLMTSFEALKKSEDNPFFKSKYVPLKQILPIIKKHCSENNFAFVQFPLLVEGKNTLQTTILHESGEKVSGSVEIVAKDATDPQKIGAGITYMRRYMLTCMFGLEEDDDDGNTASGKTAKTAPKPTEKIGFCKLCGEQGIKSPKGYIYCPNWKMHNEKKEKPTFGFPDEKRPQHEQDFIDSLPTEEDIANANPFKK